MWFAQPQLKHWPWAKLLSVLIHPSNEFFKQFPNCRTYDDGNGFVEATLKALTEKPSQLSEAQMHELSWEAATERFLRVSELDQTFGKRLSESPSNKFASTSLNLRRKVEDASAYIHYVTSGFEATRRAFGAIPASLQPDEDQCKELGLSQGPSKRKRHRLGFLDEQHFFVKGMCQAEKQ
ncbi:hypothetical protein Patl1_00389 [Pistacia atlantica]|uniref:Uncharacterized protein n=1 Tax=Pistacia atlantica TaxID=434234 RepID=A0ACC1C3A5_9ROSI|nr:hypothetical protein Patl1_00389 [Pistacia atlantica]